MFSDDLVGKPFGYLNLDFAARGWRQNPTFGAGKNYLLVPHVTQTMLDNWHFTMGIFWSYGGWLEDRSYLWRDSYLEEKKNFIHLGVDFNVPVGTRINFNRRGTVVHVGNDHPLVGGWGPHVLVRLKFEPIVLIYGHLDPCFLPSVGDELRPGQYFARVGKDTENGGWFSHLHVQAVIDEDTSLSYKDRMNELDGYGRKEDLSILARQYPDPLRFIDLV